MEAAALSPCCSGRSWLSSVTRPEGRRPSAARPDGVRRACRSVTLSNAPLETKVATRNCVAGEKTRFVLVCSFTQTRIHSHSLSGRA